MGRLLGDYNAEPQAQLKLRISLSLAIVWLDLVKRKKPIDLTFSGGKKRIIKSALVEIGDSLEDYFKAMQLSTLLLEKETSISVKGFIADYLRNINDITDENDILDRWPLNSSIATDVFQLCQDVTSNLNNSEMMEEHEPQDSSSYYQLLEETSDSEIDLL